MTDRMAANNDDSFYDSVVAASAEFSSPEPSMTEEERLRKEAQWKAELAKLDEEILTLKSVLNAKIHEATELKRKLGITPMVELKDDLKHGWQAIRDSDTVQKTNEKLQQLGENIAASSAYQKTNNALKNFGAFASKKMGDLKNSNAFKSVEGKVGGAYTSIKHQMSGEGSVEVGEEALQQNDLHLQAEGKTDEGSKVTGQN